MFTDVNHSVYAVAGYPGLRQCKRTIPTQPLS